MSGEAGRVHWRCQLRQGDERALRVGFTMAPFVMKGDYLSINFDKAGFRHRLSHAIHTCNDVFAARSRECAEIVRQRRLREKSVVYRRSTSKSPTSLGCKAKAAGTTGSRRKGGNGNFYRRSEPAGSAYS